MVPYTKEQLMTLPMVVLEHQNIETKEEERLVQEVLNIRRATLPPQQEIYRLDAMQANITTKEEEEEWQKVIDARVAKLKPQVQVLPGEETTEPVETLTTPKIELTEPIKAPMEETPQPEVEARFCEFCDSKGGRHKLNCTRERSK